MLGYRMLQSSLPLKNSLMMKQLFNPLVNQISARGIKFHEYQAAALLQKYGIPVPPVRLQILDLSCQGVPIFKQRQAKEAAQSLGSDTEYVVKAQVHGGGRGLGYFKQNNLQSGVHLVKTAHEAAEIADKMIGNTLITKQSGQEGFACNAVYIVEKLKVAGEIYVAITLDRKQGCPVLVYSPHGGVSIQDVAKQDPSKIFKLPITDLNNGPGDSELSVAASQNLGFSDKTSVDDFITTAKSLFNCFVKSDADMIQINPMTISPNGRMMALDAKITVDDNAAFRQKEIAEAQDISTQNFKQKLARQFDLSYIHIGGNIGCLVNGAGLAMATMDIIKVHGGDPANFLDIGGSADSHQIIEAIRLLNNDVNVKTVFVNIFGGILQTDLLVQSIIDASKIEKYSKPIILRMKGTNSDRAKELLRGKQQDLGIHFDDNFDTAAKMAVKLAQ